MQESARQYGGAGAAGGARQITRVLVVGCAGDDADKGKVFDVLSGMREGLEVVRAENFLAAMGELAIREVDVVIGAVSGLHLSASAISRGLRRIAPNARLLLIGDADDGRAASQALLAGFDAMVGYPVRMEDLHQQMFGEQAQAAVSQHETLQAEQKITGADTDQLPAQHAGREVAAVGRDVVKEVDAGQCAKRTATANNANNAGHANTAATAAIEVADTPVATEELGDVDLIEAILAGRGVGGGGGGAFRERLVELIRQQSGLTGLHIIGAADDLPTGWAGALVEDGGHVFGKLCGDGVNQAELGPWATWASKWCAMERQVLQLRQMSMRDELTGAWNRRYFNRFLKRILERAEEDRSQVTLLIFDIDDFKRYNDLYGHAAGDEILKETARLMGSVVREHDVVARIGGDEFAVIFWDAEGKRRPNSTHPDDVVTATQRFQKAVCKCEFPKLGEQAMGRLTVSGGLASYPWDGRTPRELMEKADLMALESKKQGKNVMTMGPGVRKGPRG